MGEKGFDMLKNLECIFILMGLIFLAKTFSIQASSMQTFSMAPEERKKNVVHDAALEWRTLPQKPQGRIIFVDGSCSSGKSSMAKIIAEKLHAKSFNFDEYVMPLILKKFITKHYGKFLAFFISGFVMRNFFKMINLLSEKKKYQFQKKFYNDLRDGLAIEPTLKMYRAVKKVALQGRDVVVESPIFLWDGVDFLDCLKTFDGTNITYVLAYCPWDDLISRIQKRNLSKSKRIRRELDWVVINYMYCFDITPEFQGEHFLECLNGKNVHDVITEYSQAKYKKKRMCLLSETQSLALQKFPEDIGYYIYPRFNHDITVNTKIHSPEEGAQVVLDYINNK
jgi:chloramphenicol 3-O-phosphotransferase